jgi:hypothetical protein
VKASMITEKNCRVSFTSPDDAARCAEALTRARIEFSSKFYPAQGAAGQHWFYIDSESAAQNWTAILWMLSSPVSGLRTSPARTSTPTVPT